MLLLCQAFHGANTMNDELTALDTPEEASVHLSALPPDMILQIAMRTRGLKRMRGAIRFDLLAVACTRIQRRQRQAAATVLDQRALLSSGGDVTQPSLAIRLQAGCLRCLASMAEVSEMIGRIKDNLMQATPPAPA